jgi:DNA-binding beta-propeller fold protein YncE
MSRIMTIAALVATVGGPLVAQSIPEISFTAIDLLRTPTEGPFVGEVAGVGANSRGQIFVYTRTGHPYATLGDNRTFSRGGSKLFLFDAKGNFVREWGQDVYGFNAAIGLRVDPQDNVWTIDAAANQVVKFNADGSIGLVLGRKPETISVRPNQPQGAQGAQGAGANRAPGSGIPGSGFNRPSDVAWDKAGNIYVADGIGTNNRIAKFDKEGRFLRHWGSTGSGPGQFNGVKAIALDAQGNVYAADAGNKRIQVFDGDGNFLREFGNVGTPLAICMTRGATQYLYVSHAGDEDGMDDAAIYKVQLDGRIVGKFGAAGKLMKEFGLANSIDCRSENELLIGEMTNWRVQKVSLK